MPNDSSLFILHMITESMKKVDKRYYCIPRAEMISPKLRERTYCYELYHQMRIYQEGMNGYNDIDKMSIHGEIDKRGDRNFPEGFNPDFIFHVPGKDAHNIAVVEVKVNWKREQAKKDFTTLSNMVIKHGYQSGIFVLIGNSQDYINHCINKSEVNYFYSEISNLRLVENDIYIITQTYPDYEIPQVRCMTLKDVHSGCGNQLHFEEPFI